MVGCPAQEPLTYSLIVLSNFEYNSVAICLFFRGLCKTAIQGEISSKRPGLVISKIGSTSDIDLDKQ